MLFSLFSTIQETTLPGPNSKCSKTVEVGYSCSELKLYQCKIATNEIQEKDYRQYSNTKTCVQSIDPAQCSAKWPGAAKRFNRQNETHVVRHTATCLDHQAMSWYRSTGKKLYINLHIWQT